MIRYLVMALRTPEFDATVIEAHQAFLTELRLQDKLELSGPFTDKSGGAYLVRAASREEAEALVFSDPVHTSGSSIVTVYEWDAK